MGLGDKIKSTLGISSGKEGSATSGNLETVRMIKAGSESVENYQVTGNLVGAPPPVALNPAAVASTNNGLPVEATPLTARVSRSTEDRPPEVSSTASELTNSNEINSDPKSAVEVLPKSGDEASADADGASMPDDEQKTVLIDVEYLRNLHDAVENNSKQNNEMAGSFKALVEMIETLNADTVSLLGQKSAQLEAANAELERLKSEEEDRIRANDRLTRENSKFKDKCDEYDGIIQGKDAQIAQLANDLKAAQDDSAVKDGKISELLKSQQDALEVHAEEVAKLKSDHQALIADLEKKHEEDVEALNKNTAEQIEATRASVNEFVPAEVCDLFDYRVGDPIDDRSRWQAIYAYLGFINGNLRQDAFVRRFREFDAALYDAMRDTPDQLAECRARVQRHINEEIGKKAGGLLVCWPKIGEPCNPDQYTTTSDFGQRISEVVSAMVYKKGDGGKVLCQSKGKVATA